MPKKIVIVAQTEQEVAEVIGYLRDRSGYEVEFCPLGPETLACIRRGRPNAVVVRISKPVPDMFHTVEVLRSEPVTSTVPLVLCCTEPPDCAAMVKQKQMLGIFLTDFPCGPVELAAKIEEALAFHWPPGRVNETGSRE